MKIYRHSQSTYRNIIWEINIYKARKSFIYSFFPDNFIRVKSRAKSRAVTALTNAATSWRCSAVIRSGTAIKSARPNKPICRVFCLIPVVQRASRDSFGRRGLEEHGVRDRRTVATNQGKSIPVRSQRLSARSPCSQLRSLSRSRRNKDRDVSKAKCKGRVTKAINETWKRKLKQRHAKEAFWKVNTTIYVPRTFSLRFPEVSFAFSLLSVWLTLRILIFAGGWIYECVRLLFNHRDIRPIYFAVSTKKQHAACIMRAQYHVSQR